MKKRLLAILSVVLVCAMIFVACSKDNADGFSESYTQTDITEQSESESESETKQDVKLTTYRVENNIDKISESTMGIEFCASYTDAILVSVTSNKVVKYKVYVNGTETGTITVTVSKSPKELPGTADKAGEKVFIRLSRVEYNVEDTVTFIDIRLNGTLHTLDDEIGGVATNYKIAENKDKINILGRSVDNQNGITADWSASGIEFRASYTGAVKISAVLDNSMEVTFRAYVNGVETGDIKFTKSGEALTIPGTAAAAGENVLIRLARVQYVYEGMITLCEISLNGTLKAWSEDRPLIEFCGDSITCGFGSVTNDNFRDGTRTYAFLAANELGADYSMVSVSGIKTGGLADNYDYVNFVRNNTTVKYTPERKADLVVIHLGTNDYGAKTDETTFKNDAKRLISKVRNTHEADVKIVWVIGHMVPADCDIYAWVKEVFTELGGNGLYTVTTTMNTAGGVGHPNYASHKVTAADLVTFIKNNGLLN